MLQCCTSIELGNTRRTSAPSSRQVCFNAAPTLSWEIRPTRFHWSAVTRPLQCGPNVEPGNTGPATMIAHGVTWLQCCPNVELGVLARLQCCPSVELGNTCRFHVPGIGVIVLQCCPSVELGNTRVARRSTVTSVRLQCCPGVELANTATSSPSSPCSSCFNAAPAVSWGIPGERRGDGGRRGPASILPQR